MCLRAALGAPVGAGYVRFHELARTLREQCPWDREQTHASLMPYLVEETFELVDALEALDPDDPATDAAVIEELGDLLYQIEFHAAIAEQEGRFSIADVTDGIHDKLVRRHPHVFGGVARRRRRRGARQLGADQARREGAHVGVRRRPARSRRWPTPAPRPQGGQGRLRLADVTGPLAKVDEELDELARRASGDAGRIADELGDVVFAIVNVARHLGVDAELALRAAAAKFRRRFEAVEALAAERGIDLRPADLATLDALWDEVKAAEPGR